MRTVDIPTEKPYQVRIGRRLLEELGEQLALVHRPCRTVVVTDSTDRGMGYTENTRSSSYRSFMSDTSPARKLTEL